MRALAFALLLAAPARAAFTVTFEAPGYTQSLVSNTVVYGFEDLAPGDALTATGPGGQLQSGSTDVGFIENNIETVDGPATVTGRYFVGGLNNPQQTVNPRGLFGASNHLSVGYGGGGDNSSSYVELRLSAQVFYFGFYWTAGDENNRLEFRNGDTLMATFNTGDLLNSGRLSGDSDDGRGSAFEGFVPVPADGPAVGVYDRSGEPGSLEQQATVATDGHFGNPYFSQPISGFPGVPNNTPFNNAFDPYVFLNFFAGPGLTFDRIRLIDAGDNGFGTLFENDNHSLRFVPTEVRGEFLGTIDAAGNLQAVPAPAGLPLAVVAGGLFAGFRRRRA